jgi:hypothetical protein
MTLVIFSYPGHFGIMQLAYRYALVSFDNITDTVVVWDDLYPTDTDFKSQISKVIPNCSVVLVSDLPACRDEKDGWLRQQYIKLNLHQLLPGNSWIVLDADTVLRNPRPLIQGDAVIVYGDPWEYYQPYFEFIKYALALDKQDTPSFMSPYWLCERAVLEAIETDSMQRHGQDIVAVWKNYCINNNDWRALSEVELYGLFAMWRLNKKFIFVQPNLKCCLQDEFIKLWPVESQDLCLGGTDNFPKEFWEKVNIIPYVDTL